MKYEKNPDGSYMYNCYVKLREGDNVTIFDSSDESVKASLNGYAVIPIEDYNGLCHGVSPQKLELSVGFDSIDSIDETHRQLHGE